MADEKLTALPADSSPGLDSLIEEVDDPAGTPLNKKVTLGAVQGLIQANTKLDDLVAPDDNTDLNASTSKHGLLPKLGGGTANFLRADGTWAAPATTRAITFVIDGAGATITTGVKGDLSIPFAGTITGARLLADQSGSIVVDIWKDTYANYPPTSGDSITASAKPTISSATKANDTTLTGWTTSISAGDTLRFNVDSCTTIQRCTVVLTVTA
jgi:hypothetical protein